MKTSLLAILFSLLVSCSDKSGVSDPGIKFDVSVNTGVALPFTGSCLMEMHVEDASGQKEEMVECFMLSDLQYTKDESAFSKACADHTKQRVEQIQNLNYHVDNFESHPSFQANCKARHQSSSGLFHSKNVQIKCLYENEQSQQYQEIHFYSPFWNTQSIFQVCENLAKSIDSKRSRSEHIYTAKRLTKSDYDIQLIEQMGYIETSSRIKKHHRAFLKEPIQGLIPFLFELD